MPIMPDIPFVKSRVQGPAFNAIGIVVHKTEAGYQHCLKGFQHGPKAPHFLIGKREYQVAQLVDTSYLAAHVGPGANALYIGIEFESILARPGIHGQDPLVNEDELTPYQMWTGRQIIDWICKTHGIRKVGPPTSSQWRQCGGRWPGVLGHANVAEGGFFKTNHGDTVQFIDMIALEVWPQ